MKVSWNVEVEASAGEIAEIVEKARPPTNTTLEHLQELYRQHLDYLHGSKPASRA